ncbi:DUF962 domain-containing protein [Alteromonadaceae bacterium BrNp21-10]|nr:DUF962 domain-containing protein [Alteromonadaceae bacterium BrNp21-10]
MSSINSFKEFYPYYLQEHRHPVCRRLHYIGSLLVIAVLVTAIVQAQWTLLWLLPIIGYGFAWLGHFVFEKNKPATFQYPFYSLAADWIMLKDALLSLLGFATPLDRLK